MNVRWVGMEDRVKEVAIREVLREVQSILCNFEIAIGWRWFANFGTWEFDLGGIDLGAMKVGFDCNVSPYLRRRRRWRWLPGQRRESYWARWYFYPGEEVRIARELSPWLNLRQALEFIRTLRAVAEVLEQAPTWGLTWRPGPELRVAKRLTQRKAQAACRAAAMAVAELTDQQVLEALQAEAGLLIAASPRPEP